MNAIVTGARKGIGRATVNKKEKKKTNSKWNKCMGYNQSYG